MNGTPIDPHHTGRLAAPLSDEEAWSRLPAARDGKGGPLPSWARMLAVPLPRSTAALLRLDRAHRAEGPVDLGLRAAMRWVAARANRCPYAEAYAEADARRAGLDDARFEALDREGFPGWTDAERAALGFARGMTVASASVTDAEFRGLVDAFGAERAASMVLLLAHANMQDRLLLCLGAEVEPGGPLPPYPSEFDPSAFASRTTPPPPRSPGEAPATTPSGVNRIGDPGWDGRPYEELQARLEAQRERPTRLRIPDWGEFEGRLPEGLFQGPSDIVWYRVCFGYAPELAVAFEWFMRTAGAEAGPRWDRVFASSLFWVTTEAIDCPYCMGHCEMNWEVAGLSKPEIEGRSRLLADGAWSGFPPEERHAFAFARTLARAPWAVSDEDIARLRRGFGPGLAAVVVLNACRYHYMTRISNGFQLRLERENVFYDYYGARPPAPPDSSASPAGVGGGGGPARPGREEDR